MNALSIIAGSWPLAIIFIAFCAAVVLLYLIYGFRADAREEREVRATTARDVTPYRSRETD